MAPLRRFGRPGLLGTAARTAVIAGTAQATAGAISRRQANRAQQQYEAQRYEAAPPPAQPVAQPQAAPPAAASGGAGNNELLAQLAQLGTLHGQGVLTDAEFAAAKAKLLG
ncbi:SHOCT domain-containing protein [Promicromonospora sp. NPDC052451]|uniref:SHOCT domain-containing protein n=1 Tax=Promicromonospora sp. NPDC052451 TaxID=3364407 RepID=UPI0037C76225